LKLKFISQNKTAIFVAHDPNEALPLSDKIGYTEEGKIIQFDMPINLHKYPETQSAGNLWIR